MTLDPCCCWVDCWSFERMARQAEVLWNRASKKDMGEAVRLTEKALNLHPGLFLPADEAHFWTIPCREASQSGLPPAHDQAGQLPGRDGFLGEGRGVLP